MSASQHIATEVEQFIAEKVEEALSKLDERSAATLLDIRRCPGLYAGQYDAIERVPRGLVHYYCTNSASYLLGLSNARLTELGETVAERWEDQQ